MLRLALLVALVTACNPQENLSLQVSAAYVDTLRNMGPSGWWRLGEVQGSVAYDQTLAANHGHYHDVLLDREGAIRTDVDRSNEYQGKTDSFVEVADREAYSLTRAFDHFNRPCFQLQNQCVNVGWGTGASGESWQVEAGSGLYYNTNGSHAYIDPDGTSGVFQQGLPGVRLDSGEMQIRAAWGKHPGVGAVQPVALVHRLDANNDVRAELIEKEDKILELALVKTVAGVESIIASAWIRDANNDPVTYEVGDWWYLRFKFDGARVAARAWRQGTEQPCAWLVDGDAAPIDTGTLSVRYSNLNSDTKPIVTYEDFWAQHPGLSFQMFVYIASDQPATSEDGGGTRKVHLFGKGTEYDSPWNPFDHGNQEYHLRWMPEERHLKAYVFNLAGNLGAGQRIHQMHTVEWYHVAVVLSPGDALDQTAGITMYVNGDAKMDGSGEDDGRPVRQPPVTGSYNGAQHCEDAVRPDPLVCSVQDAGGVPGTCSDIPLFGNTSCTDHDGEEDQQCWTIYPFCGDAPLLFGTADKSDWFHGRLDEVAIWNRMLTKDEVQTLFSLSGIAFP